MVINNFSLMKLGIVILLYPHTWYIPHVISEETIH